METLNFAQILPVVQLNIASHFELGINARQLHAALQVGRQFNHWIKERIEKYGFQENVDYVVINTVLNQTASNDALANFGQCENQGPVRTDYYFTIGTAKELAMIENNDIGRQVRRYFIEAEKQLRESMPNFNDPLEAAKAWVKAEESRRAAEALAKEKQLALEQEQAAHENTLAELGRAKQFRSCLAMGEKLSQWFNIKYINFEGDSFYSQLGVLMTMLCNGGRCGKLFTNDPRFCSTTFQMIKEHVPNSRFGYINAYDMEAWNYFFDLCKQFNPATFPRVKTFAK